jgi:hypothetical protein
MKIILTEDQYGQLTEMIKLDIKVGDTIMGGKFKNKKIVVKTIGKNNKGDITINGKPLLRFRIIKESTSNDIEKKYKTYSKLLNELTETFDWVSKIDVKLSSTAEAGGWRNEESKPLLKVSVYFKNYQKIRMTTQFELFDEISFIHDMFFPQLTGDPLIYSDNVTAYFSVKSVFPNGKTDSFPSQNQIVSGDYDAVSQISESNDKNKKFLISVMGMDFTDKIQQITSTHDVPTSFDDGIAPSTIRTYLNFWGPMYLVNIDGKNYLYQDRGDFEMFIDEDGYWNKDEIPEKLGIGILGLRFSDILDMYFEEGDHR